MSVLSSYSFEDVITPDVIDSILEKGFNCGAGYGQTEETHCCESLDRLFEDNDVEENKEKEFLTTWLPKRFSYVVNNLKSCHGTDNDRMTIYRHLYVDEDRISDILTDSEIPLGEYWTCVNQVVDGWGDIDKCSVFIEASVALSDINWKTTILRNMNYVYGDDEVEIALSPGTPVLVNSISVEGEPVPVACPERCAGNKTATDEYVVSPSM